MIFIKNKSNSVTGCSRLWSAVFLQGVNDAAEGYATLMACARRGEFLNVAKLKKDHQRDGIRWFISDRDGVGSFNWICGLFGWDADNIRGRLVRKWGGVISLSSLKLAARC